MDNFTIEIPENSGLTRYKVVDYPFNDEDNHCKFEVFRNEALVASFEPDRRGFLQVCKNPGNLDENILDLLAEKIESYHF